LLQFIIIASNRAQSEVTCQVLGLYFSCMLLLKSKPEPESCCQNRQWKHGSNKKVRSFLLYNVGLQFV
jgi:hypothetical protein